jgi:hypothetical protein
MHIGDEELERYALKRLRAREVFTLESHLAACSTCTGKLPQHLAFALRLRTLSKKPPSANGDKRREHRITTNEPAQMRLLNPSSGDILNILILNRSASGVKVSLPVFLSSKALVQIRYKQSIIFGEVRYCVPNGDEHHAGIKIQDVFSISSFCSSFPPL